MNEATQPPALPQALIQQTLISARRALQIEQGQIVALQLLRGLAACAVVVEHLLQRYEKRGVLPDALPEFVSRLGQTGVFAFFAISGFIMVYITNRSGKAYPSGGAFLRARFLRVAPLYYVTTVLIVAFTWATQGLANKDGFQLPTLDQWVGSLLFIPHRGANGLIQPIYGLGWSLHYEMFFYLLFAAGLMLQRQRGVFIILAILAGLAAIGPLIDAPPQRWGLAVVAYVFTRPVMLFFMAGMIIALVHARVADRRPEAPLALIALLAMLALGLAAMLPGFMPTLTAIVASVCICVLLKPQDRSSSGIGARISSALGNASYSIYLTHSFVLGAFAAVTAGMVGAGPAVLMVLILCACTGCFVLGWAVWHWVEVPMTRRLRGRRPRPAEMVAP